MPATNTTTTATDILNVESLITSHDQKIHSLKKEIEEQKGMLDSLLEGNADYHEKLEAAKAANKAKTALRTEIYQQPEAKTMVEKIKDYRKQLTELKTALSDYLKTYEQLSGQNYIEGPDGIIKEIVHSVKLVITNQNKV